MKYLIGGIVGVVVAFYGTMLWFCLSFMGAFDETEAARLRREKRKAKKFWREWDALIKAHNKKVDERNGL